MDKPLPTDAELTILTVLWKRQAATVREVHGELSETAQTGYTTVLKTMQIMTEKGLVVRDESARSHLYRPAVKEESTQKRLVGRLIEKAFAGSSVQLAMRALSTSPATREELEEIRAFLDGLAAQEKRR